MPLLVVERLAKRFPGGVWGVRDVSFTVEEGEVVGLIGPNGAGKSTTFRVIATLLRPTSGRVVVDGFDVVKSPHEVRRRVTFVPEEVGGYRYLTGRELLELLVTAYVRARGGGRAEAEEALEEAVRLSGLPERALDRRVGEYSKGMKRRLQVAWALAVRPRLALLDEPTSGLDVEASYEVRRMIRRYASSAGVTVLMSSHNMLEVEAVCDRVVLIRGGVVVDEGPPRELVERYGARNLEEAYMEAVRRRARPAAGQGG